MSTLSGGDGYLGSQFQTLHLRLPGILLFTSAHLSTDSIRYRSADFAGTTSRRISTDVAQLADEFIQMKLYNLNPSPKKSSFSFFCTVGSKIDVV